MYTIDVFAVAMILSIGLVALAAVKDRFFNAAVGLVGLISLFGLLGGLLVFAGLIQ